MSTTNIQHNPQSAVSKTYAAIIYWSTIVATLVVIICMTLAFLGMDNVIAPAELFNSIWMGNTTAEIWAQSRLVDMPNSNWYIEHIWQGDALVMCGIVLGILSVVPGSYAAAIAFYKGGHKFFALMGFLTATLILLPFLNLF